MDAELRNIEPLPEPEAAADKSEATAESTPEEVAESEDETEEVSAPPLDLAGYAEAIDDPEAADLRLVEQVIPMLDQLSAQAVKVPLAALAAQELAVLFLQVLPQALPPQYVQALLS